jgi:D-alanyl-D-alanine carboxypeptidase
VRSKAQGLTPFIPLFVSVIFLAIWAPVAVLSAPYAAMVIDARSGEVLHSRNADTRLHPASLTKMMTLYIAFEAIERGEISLDQKVLVSQKAAAEPPSKLGLKAGQRIALRYLIRAAAVKSANDAATAIAEAIEGSEAAFARRMNRTANALGMTRTTFKNAHGLTESGHLSTARDMTTMGRRLFYDYPQYYNIFSRQTTDAGIRDVANTNRRLLASYKGADGIKTGYTNAAGFNLVASAERGNERVIATVFGGRSTATRNARVAELLDLGFKRAPSRVAVRKPPAPLYPSTSGAEKSVRTVLAIAQSPRPRARPGPVAPPGVLTAAVQETVSETLALIELDTKPAQPLVNLETALADVTDTAPQAPALPALAQTRPPARPASITAAAVAVAAAQTTPETVTPAALAEAASEEVVTRMSTSGGRHWGISVGSFSSRHQAERILLQTALLELGTLDEALRKVVPKSGRYDANFVGLSAEQADLACRRLSARNVDCAKFGPG